MPKVSLDIKALQCLNFLWSWKKKLEMLDMYSKNQSEVQETRYSVCDAIQAYLRGKQRGFVHSSLPLLQLTYSSGDLLP